MKKHLNEISKYFKPVDYIEELTHEEEEKQIIQNGYASNASNMKEIASQFNYNTDTVILTFYKTIYQTGDTFTIDLSQTGMLEPSTFQNNMYSCIVSIVMYYMHAMLCDKKQPYYKYTGISATIKYYSDEFNSYKNLTVVYIPDVKKYKSLVCAESSGLNCSVDFRRTAHNVESISGASIDIYTDFNVEYNFDGGTYYIMYRNALDALLKFADIQMDYDDWADWTLEIPEFERRFNFRKSPLEIVKYLYKAIYGDTVVTYSTLKTICDKDRNNPILSDVIRLIQTSNISVATILCNVVNAKIWFNADAEEFIDNYKQGDVYVEEYMLDKLYDIPTEENYIKQNSVEIEKQLKNLSNAIATALNIKGAELHLTYRVIDLYKLQLKKFKSSLYKDITYSAESNLM